ncbi:mycobactin salicyl-AMP ligase [Syntrophus gentianae]|uniref:Mycobactin salicyl-AMP ligase n=1 Tax=Syntrophus gentianae TaxID=43775 RepID=A0A1H7VQ86_9BACT|nr:AMP-binding protein [Syntrophus gentianae]SEM11421.1 mycobactin salicyl-AMP ligase [Syntrophus gentianae]
MKREDFPRHRKEDEELYLKKRWWLGMTLGDVLDRTADVFSNKVAVADDNGQVTWSELKAKVDRLAVSLMDLGIGKGDCVLLQLPNWHEYVCAYFAMQRIGAVPVLLISGYRQLEVGHLGLATEAKAWIVPDVYRKMDYVSFMDEVKAKNPQMKHVISVRATKGGAGFTTSLEKLMEGGLTDADRERLAMAKPEATDIAHIVPSGGTTGLPKGIPRTHNDYICDVEFLHKGWEMSTSDVALLVVPVGHNLALLNVVGTAVVGYKLVLTDSTRPGDLCKLIEQHKVSYMPLVPTLVRRILESPDLTNYDLTSLRKISAGGEPSTPDLIRDVYKKLNNCTYVNEFGMSEGILTRTSMTDDIDTICSTVGKPCCPYAVIKIIDDKGKELPRGTDGELAVWGPTVFAGYLKNPEENKKSYTADGLFRTGDQARINAAGYLTITGRIKDIIIRGGENITPSQVEDILCSHPGIADAAVIGMPDKVLGEQVCAYVRPAAGVKLDPEEIKAFMDSQGASKLLVPERFEFVDAIPMTQAGKHDKKALKKDIKEKLGIS